MRGEELGEGPFLWNLADVLRTVGVGISGLDTAEVEITNSLDDDARFIRDILGGQDQEVDK